MKITIAAIGKESRNSPTTDLFKEYTKRLPWDITLKEFDSKNTLPPKQQMDKEAELLLSAVDSSTRLVALDERGKNISSEDFAAQIATWQIDGIHKITFAIGGAHGHGEAVRQRADLLLSFGKLTWPHMMVRPMLAEQIYRAYTILTGHPYHRG